jgi:hypothetical protein
MKRKEVIVTIDAGGQTTVTVEGVPGPACEDVTRDVEQSLGAVVGRERTAEYFQRSAQTQGRRRQSTRQP